MDKETENKIRAKYPVFNNEIINLISGEAYRKGHNAGREEVNMYAIEMAYFADMIIKAYKE